MWQRWLFLFSLVVFSGSAWADNSCEVTPTSDFTVTASIANYQSSTNYDLKADKGGSHVLVWSNHDPEAKILSTDLVDGESYDFRFVFNMENTDGKKVNGTLVYYRRISGNEVWSEVGRTEVTLHQGANTDMTIIGSDSITCNDVAEDTPSEVPDICSIVPGVLQTNSYVDGHLSESGQLGVSGEENKIILPYDNMLMSFKYYTSVPQTDCDYPSSPNSACKIDDNKVIDGYPYDLGNNPATADLTIHAGETISLVEGVHWYNNIVFEGDGARLSIEGKVIIHYNTISFPTGKLYEGDDGYQHVDGTVHINDDGDSTNLLFIGHGSNAQIVTEHESLAVHANAHFYIDDGATTGLSLGGSDSVFNGGVTANNVAISGINNIFDGTGSCEPEPEPEPEDDDICTYFPGTIQGNTTDTATNFLHLVNGNGGNGNRLYIDTRDELQFDEIKDDLTENPPSGCVYTDGSGASDTNGNLIVESCPEGKGGAKNIPVLKAFDTSGTEFLDGIETGQSDKEISDILPGKYKFLKVQAGDATVELTPGVYWFGSLEFNSAGQALKVVGDGAVIIHYNSLIMSERLALNNDQSIRTNVASTEPQKLSEEQSPSPSKLVLLGHGPDSGIQTQGNQTFINALWYVSPEAEVGLEIDSSQRFQFIGAISAPRIFLDGGNDYNYIYAKGAAECINPPDTDTTYNIDISIDKDISLTCQNPVATITVKDEDGNPYTGSVDVSVDPSTGLTLGTPADGKGEPDESVNGRYTPNSDGIIEIPLTGDTYGSYTVTATLVGEDTDPASDSVEFVPFSFEADDQYVIASQPQNMTIQAMACDPETDKPIATEYEGTPKTEIKMKSPSTGVSDWRFSQELSFSKENQGIVEREFTFDDSGKAEITISDDQFQCTSEQAGCPYSTDEGAGIATMKGSFTVYSRPWTFAICPKLKDDAEFSPADGHATDLTNGAGDGFVAAGVSFDTYVRPLRWVSGQGKFDPKTGKSIKTDDNEEIIITGDSPAEIDVTALCDSAATVNFFDDESPSSKMLLTHDVAEPDPEVADKGSLSGESSHDNTDASENDYSVFHDVSWSEVGVLKMNADVESDYSFTEDNVNLDINLGYRNLGRFYPDHLVHISNRWEYDEGLDTFAYMNQPIGMSFIIEARTAGENPTATKNYGLFDPSLQDSFKLVAVKTGSDGVETGNLTGRLSFEQNADSGWVRSLSSEFSELTSAQFYAEDPSFSFLKLGSANTDGAYASTPDGPYTESNAKFGVSVDKMVDDLDFAYDVDTDSEFVDGSEIGSDNTNSIVQHGVEFITHPDFRYGRMKLDNVSGPIGGPVSVPLRVEYWDGENFVTNTDDNGSQFFPEVYYVMSDHSKQDGSGAHLDKASGAGVSPFTVVEGASNKLVAAQSDSNKVKETARIFLRQGNESSGYGNSSKPADDDELNTISSEWSTSTDVEQPWLQYNERGKGDEDPSTQVTFGAYRGNDRIIYRGEPELTAN